jgi:CRP-like cAMP-binding protein
LKEIWPVIKNAPLFTGIDSTELESLLHCLQAKLQEFGREEYLFRVGDRAESLGMLLHGSVLVVQEDFWGNRNLMSRIAPGQVFAEAFACSPGAVLNVSVVADEPGTVMWLNVQRILNTCPTACTHHVRMIRNLLSDLANKSLQFNEKLTHIGQRTTREKLLSYLSAEAQRKGCSTFDIPFDRQQLADYLSVERSAMSAELSRLQKQGVLAYTKNHFSLRQSLPELSGPR